MGVDVVVHQPCDAKRALGDGDVVRGTDVIVGMIKARGRAEVALSHHPGKAPEDVAFTVVVHGPDGLHEDQVTAAEMLARSAPLAAHADGCARCPANRLGHPYGCVGSIAYPITQRAEQWLVDRIVPERHRQLAGALREAGDGAPMAAWRERGLLEAAVAPSRDVGGSALATGDQVLQALLASGSSLDPMHCALVLVWLGALAIDGGAHPEPVRALTELTTAEARTRRTAFSVDPVAERDVAEVRGLLGFLYSAYVVGVPVLVDA